MTPQPEEVAAHVRRQEEEARAMGYEFKLAESRQNEGGAGAKAKEAESSDDETGWEERVQLPELGKLPYGSAEQRRRAMRMASLWNTSPEEWLEVAKEQWRYRRGRRGKRGRSRKQRPSIGAVASKAKPLIRHAVANAEAFVKPSGLNSRRLRPL